MRGYVDFIYNYTDTGATDTADYSTASDADFRFVPVTLSSIWI